LQQQLEGTQVAAQAAGRQAEELAAALTVSQAEVSFFVLSAVLFVYGHVRVCCGCGCECVSPYAYVCVFVHLCVPMLEACQVLSSRGS
jgi:hypothetical protein